MKVNLLTPKNVQSMIDDSINDKFEEIDDRLRRINLLTKDIEKLLEKAWRKK